MKEKQILIEWARLADPKDLQGQIESYKMIADVAMQILYQEKKVEKSPADQDANYLYQMTSLKCLSIIRLVEKKLNYVNDISKFKMNVYDPFGLKPIIRAQFEAFGHFNNNYTQYSSEDEKKLKYDIWVMCGLMNRQKFDAIQPETVARKEKEKKDIEDLENKIKENPCYKNLTDKAQKRIFEMAENANWKITIIGNNAVFVGWQQLADNAGTNANLKSMYRHFSLSAHPTNVSVFQFRDAYERGNEAADFLQ